MRKIYTRSDYLTMYPYGNNSYTLKILEGEDDYLINLTKDQDNSVIFEYTKDTYKEAITSFNTERVVLDNLYATQLNYQPFIKQIQDVRTRSLVKTS